MKLLWDIDGTIFDTYPAILESFMIVYEEVHGEELDPAEANLWLKRPAAEVFTRFEIPEIYQERYYELNNERAGEGIPPFEGIEEILAAAKINVIVTHRDNESAEALLEDWGLLHYFDEIISPNDAGYTSNPETSAHQYLLDKYELDWAIGDSEIDLAPAEDIGMKTCAFQNDAIEADLYITEYTSLLIEKLSVEY